MDVRGNTHGRGQTVWGIMIFQGAAGERSDGREADVHGNRRTAKPNGGLWYLQNKFCKQPTCIFSEGVCPAVFEVCFGFFLLSIVTCEKEQGKARIVKKKEPFSIQEVLSLPRLQNR